MSTNSGNDLKMSPIYFAFPIILLGGLFLCCICIRIVPQIRIKFNKPKLTTTEDVEVSYEGGNFIARAPSETTLNIIQVGDLSVAKSGTSSFQSVSKSRDTTILFNELNGTKQSKSTAVVASGKPPSYQEPAALQAGPLL